jgi:hypothetical protein
VSEGFTPALIDELLDVALGRESMETFVRRLINPLRGSAIAGAEHIAGLLQAGVLVTENTRALQDFVVTHTPKLQGVHETTCITLRNALQATIRDGGTLDDQIATIREVFRQADGVRAMNIARTENGIFWHVGGRQQMLAGGVPARIWLTSRDQRVRASHIPMDNQCRPIDAPFLTGAGVELMHPCDPAGPPGEIIQCRCTEAPLPSGCDAKAGLYGTEAKRAAVWKFAIAALMQHERLVQRESRRAFRVQRDARLARARLMLGMTN